MTFLQSGFLFLLLPLTLILFGLWITQKPMEHRWISDAMLRRLRAPDPSIGLQGRNFLFLGAAVLMIIAMAQPVIMTPSPFERAVQTAVVIDLDPREFEMRRLQALNLLSELRGEEIEVAAFDSRLYRIAPLTRDTGIVSELIARLGASQKSSELTDSIDFEPLASADAVAVLSNRLRTENSRVRLIRSVEEVQPFVAYVRSIKAARRSAEHIPLFYYPLGLSMILILLALSSMSRRESVKVAVMLLALSVPASRSEAGVLDFLLLKEAREAYESGDCHTSEALYRTYQKEHDSPQVRYNRANSLYRCGYYSKAAFWYARVSTNDPVLRERAAFNLERAREKMIVSEANTAEGNTKSGRSASAPSQSAKAHSAAFPPTPLFKY